MEPEQRAVPLPVPTPAQLTLVLSQSKALSSFGEPSSAPLPLSRTPHVTIGHRHLRPHASSPRSTRPRIAFASCPRCGTFIHLTNIGHQRLHFRPPPTSPGISCPTRRTCYSLCPLTASLVNFGAFPASSLVVCIIVAIGSFLAPYLSLVMCTIPYDGPACRVLSSVVAMGYCLFSCIGTMAQRGN